MDYTLSEKKTMSLTIRFIIRLNLLLSQRLMILLPEDANFIKHLNILSLIMRKANWIT